jgi:hypothetical protein
MSFKPTPDSAASLTIWLGGVNVNAAVSGVNLYLGLGHGFYGLASADVGDQVQVLGAGPSGAPLWTTIATVASAGICTMATAASTAIAAGAQVTIYRPLDEAHFGTDNAVLQDSIVFERSLTTRGTLDFTIKYNYVTESIGVFGIPTSLVGNPVLLTDSSLATAPFGGQVGDIFGGSIEQAKVTNYPGTGRTEIEVQCVAWEAICARRLIVLCPTFQTSPEYQAGQQYLTFNGAPYDAVTNPMGVQSGISQYLPPGSPPGTAPTVFHTRWFSIYPAPTNIVLITVNGTAVAYGPYNIQPPWGAGGYDFYWSPADNPSIGIDPSLVINPTDVFVFTVNGTAASGGSNIIPSLNYTGVNADAIAVNLINLIAASEGITVDLANVTPAVGIQAIQFTASQSIDAALASLCQYISGAAGAYWYYLDPRKGFNFAIQGVSNPAPWNISELDASDGNVLMKVSCSVTREKYFNATWLDLSQLSNQVSVYCQGDNSTQSFQLPYPVAAAPTVTRYDGIAPNPLPSGVITFLQAFAGTGTGYTDGDLLTLHQPGSGNNATVLIFADPNVHSILSWNLGNPGTGYNDIDPFTCTGGTGTGAHGYCVTAMALAMTVGEVGKSGFDFYWSPGSNELKQDAGQAPITSSQFLLVVYQPSSSSYAQYLDQVAIGVRQLAEGGSGEYDTYLDLANTLPLVQGPPAQAVGLEVAQTLSNLFSVLSQELAVDTYRTGIAPGMSIVVSLNRVAGATFVVQSARLTDLNRLQLWSLTCVFGAIIGDWKTAVKFFTSGASAPAAVAALQTTGAAPSGATYGYFTITITIAGHVLPDYANGTAQEYTISANVTMNAILHPPTATGGDPFWLTIIQDHVGGHAITWDSSYSTGSPAIGPPQPSPLPYAETAYLFVQTDTPGIWRCLTANSNF